MGRDDPDPGGEEGAPLISGSAFTHRSLSAPAFGPSGASTRYGSAPAPARGPSGSPNNVFAWRRVRSACHALPRQPADARRAAVSGCCQLYTLVLAAGMGGLLLGYNSSNIAVALPVRSARRPGKLCAALLRSPATRAAARCRASGAACHGPRGWRGMTAVEAPRGAVQRRGTC